MVSPLEIFLFTKVASTSTLIFLLLFILLILIKTNAKQKALALLLSSCMLFATVIAAKEYFHVTRPADALIEASGYAFPSGHAAGVTFLAVVVSFLSWKQRALYRYLVLFAGIGIAVMIAYSRIAFQVHTWIQVIAGIGIGVLCGYLFIYLSSRK